MSDDRTRVLAVTTNPSLVIGLTFLGRDWDVSSLPLLEPGESTAETDVIVLDMDDAHRATSEIVALGERRPPILVVSSQQPETALAGVAFASRPFTLDELADHVDRLLDPPADTDLPGADLAGADAPAPDRDADMVGDAESASGLSAAAYTSAGGLSGPRSFERGAAADGVQPAPTGEDPAAEQDERPLSMRLFGRFARRGIDQRRSDGHTGAQGTDEPTGEAAEEAADDLAADLGDQPHRDAPGDEQRHEEFLFARPGQPGPGSAGPASDPSSEAGPSEAGPSEPEGDRALIDLAAYERTRRGTDQIDTQSDTDADDTDELPAVGASDELPALGASDELPALGASDEPGESATDTLPDAGADPRAETGPEAEADPRAGVGPDAGADAVTGTSMLQDAARSQPDAPAGPITDQDAVTAPSGRQAFATRWFSRRQREVSPEELDLRSRLARVLTATGELERLIDEVPLLRSRTDLAQALTVEIQRELDADTVGIWLDDLDERGWVAVAHHGFTYHEARMIVPPDQPLFSEVDQSGGALLIDPVESLQAAVSGIGGAHTESFMAASVSIGPGRYGVITVGRDEQLTVEHLDLLCDLAQEAAPGLAVAAQLTRFQIPASEPDVIDLIDRRPRSWNRSAPARPRAPIG